jgi:hypothetical protein
LPAFDQAQGHHLETYRSAGALAALMQVAAENGVTCEQREPGVEFPPISMQSATANAEALFKYTVPAVRRYRLDLLPLCGVTGVSPIVLIRKPA